MQTHQRAIIFLQYVKSKEHLPITSPVLKRIEQLQGPTDVVFTLDNFSDQITTHYAKKLMDQSQEILLIAEMEESVDLGALAAILNHAVRKKWVKLLVKGGCSALENYMKLLHGNSFQTAEELKII